MRLPDKPEYANLSAASTTASTDESNSPGTYVLTEMLTVEYDLVILPS